MSSNDWVSNEKPSRSRRPEQHTNNKKCMNEKRRREQETAYMEELADYISGSVSDVNKASLLKQDKCAILHETVTRVKDINSDHGDIQSTDIQLSQVSSSKPSPSILADDIVGPLILEALDGFMFMVNEDGVLEFVSENVYNYLHFTQDELVKKSVYEILHSDDCLQMTRCLESLLLTSSKESLPTDNPAFDCRLLMKNSGVKRYEDTHIVCILHSAQSGCDASGDCTTRYYMVCIARRIKAVEKAFVQQVQLFTTKQDLNGVVLACDASSHQSSCVQLHLEGKNIVDMCHESDRKCLVRHYEQVIKVGSNTSGVYRFHLPEKSYLFIQTNSKLFKNPSTNSPEFIMSTHSVVRECDGDSELIDSASASLMKALIEPNTASKKLFYASKSITSNNASLSPNISCQSNSEDLLTSLGLTSNIPELLKMVSMSGSKTPSVVDELLAMFPGQRSAGVKRPSAPPAVYNKRPRLMLSELGNSHLADLLDDNSSQQPQSISTASVESPLPDSSTSQSNPLLKRLLLDSVGTETAPVATPANEAESVQRDLKNGLLKQLLNNEKEDNKLGKHPVKLLKRLLSSDNESDDCHNEKGGQQDHPDSSTSSDVELTASSKPPLKKKKNYLLQQLLTADDLTGVDVATTDNAAVKTLASAESGAIHTKITPVASNTADCLKTSSVQIAPCNSTASGSMPSGVMVAMNDPCALTTSIASANVRHCDPVDLGYDDLFFDLPYVFDDTLLTGQFDQAITSELSLADLESWMPNDDSQVSSVQIQPNSAASVSKVTHVQKPALPATVHHKASNTEAVQSWLQQTNRNRNAFWSVNNRNERSSAQNTNHRSSITGMSPSLLAMEKKFASLKNGMMNSANVVPQYHSMSTQSFVGKPVSAGVATIPDFIDISNTVTHRFGTASDYQTAPYRNLKTGSTVNHRRWTTCASEVPPYTPMQFSAPDQRGLFQASYNSISVQSQCHTDASSLFSIYHQPDTSRQPGNSVTYGTVPVGNNYAPGSVGIKYSSVANSSHLSKMDQDSGHKPMTSSQHESNYRQDNGSYQTNNNRQKSTMSQYSTTNNMQLMKEEGSSKESMNPSLSSRFEVGSRALFGGSCLSATELLNVDCSSNITSVMDELFNATL